MIYNKGLVEICALLATSTTSFVMMLHAIKWHVLLTKHANVADTLANCLNGHDGS